MTTKHYHWTTAPEAYDYSYTSTHLTHKAADGREWRLVEVTDSYRFENFQTPRYGSGLHPTVPMAEGEQFSLPATFKALEAELDRRFRQREHRRAQSFMEDLEDALSRGHRDEVLSVWAELESQCEYLLAECSRLPETLNERMDEIEQAIDQKWWLKGEY